MYMYKNLKNLLLRAPEDGGAATSTGAVPSAVPANTPAGAQASEPAADVAAQAQQIADAIVAKKLKGMPTKEELGAFRVWQAQQKPPEDPAAKAQAEVVKLQEKVAAYERKEQVASAGVSPTYAEFVAFEAGKGVTDGVDFSAALKAYLEKNPQYNAAAKPAAWGMPQGGAAGAPDGVEAAFAKLNPGLKI